LITSARKSKTSTYQGEIILAIPMPVWISSKPFICRILAQRIWFNCHPGRPHLHGHLFSFGSTWKYRIVDSWSFVRDLTRHLEWRWVVFSAKNVSSTKRFFFGKKWIYDCKEEILEKRISQLGSRRHSNRRCLIIIPHDNFLFLFEVSKCSRGNYGVQTFNISFHLGSCSATDVEVCVSRYSMTKYSAIVYRFRVL
jgi:hypothetical protein